MADTARVFQETFDDLYKLSPKDKILFLELLIFSFTISARGIWSDEQHQDQDKVEALKWLNELNHRIWNIRFAIIEGGDNESFKRLYENIKFYGDLSALLQSHLMPTLISALDQFKNFNKTV